MDYPLSAALLSVGLLVGMLLSLEIGRTIGVRRLAREHGESITGAGAVEGAVFGLLGLLIAFTFSGAMTRFDTRRQLIVDETNAIGTAYLRLDLLPATARAELQDRFRRYVDSRLEVYRKLPDISAAEEELARSNQLQRAIWAQAIAACRLPDAAPAATMLLLPALNAMFDITTVRTMATRMHPPEIIFAMLICVALAASLLAGFGMAASHSRSWVHILGFGVALALTLYVILDTEYPRFGLIRVNAFDQALVDLRQGMQ